MNAEEAGTHVAAASVKVMFVLIVPSFPEFS